MNVISRFKWQLGILLIRPKSFDALSVIKFVILVAQLSRLTIQNGLEETDQLYYCSYLEVKPVRLQFKWYLRCSGRFTVIFFTTMLTFAITALLSRRFTWHVFPPLFFSRATVVLLRYWQPCHFGGKHFARSSKLHRPR